MDTNAGREPGEDFDVLHEHAQLMREKSEPIELARAIPAWLKHAIYAPLLIWGLWYLIVASGGFRWDEYHEGFLPTSAKMVTDEIEEKESGRDSIPDETSDEDRVSTMIAEGKTVYQSVCAACHQTNGLGLPGAFPPLAMSDWVVGDERRLALIVLHGLAGPIEVNGEPWNGVMPPQGQMLSDDQIAAVLSYIRTTWGNNALKVDPALVESLRAQYDGHAPWTESSLREALQ